MNDILGELTRMGIIADVLGAVLIARSVFFKSNKDIFKTSGAYLDYSLPKTHDAIVAKREALVGCSFLVIGFTMQYFGTFHQNDRQLLHFDIIFAFICLIIGILSIVLIRQWTDKTVKSLENEKKIN